MIDTPDTPMTEGQRGPSFWPRIHRKQIAVHLAAQPMIQGELTAFSTYEIIVKTKTGKEILIPKHAIASVDLPDGWRALPAGGTQEGSSGALN